MQGNLCKHIHAVRVSEGGEREGPGAPPGGPEGATDQVICAEARDEIQYYMSTLRARGGMGGGPGGERGSGVERRHGEVHRLAQEIQSLASPDLDIDPTALASVLASLRAAKAVLILQRQNIHPPPPAPRAGSGGGLVGQQGGANALQMARRGRGRPRGAKRARVREEGGRRR